MSKTISIPGFIYAKPAEDWQRGMADVVGDLCFTFDAWKRTSGGHVVVTPHALTFDIPTGWDPRPAQIKALEQKREELRAEFQASVTKINAQIQNLQALEFTPAEVT